MSAKTLFRCAAVLALVSTTQLAAAQAKPCLTETEVRGLVGYALPSIAESVITQCRAALPASAALMVRGPQLAGELRKGQKAAWPAAQQAIGKLAGDASDDADMFAAMPEELMGPLLDRMIATELVKDVKPQTCKDIERVFAPMSELPAPKVVDLASGLLAIAGREGKKINTCAA